jgi:mannose-1-phosphate guanylyltransferase
MIITIIAGGSGTRLWPLSQSTYPKHLLKLTGEKSLLQNTFARASKVADSVYIITEVSHADEVKSQLSELPKDHVIVEPGRRGTASCILLALAYLQDRHPADEPIVFIHADSYIKDEESFKKTLKVAANNAHDHNAVTLIGIKPTYPATGFGYIQVGETLSTTDGIEVHKALKFKEKPDLDTAQSYLETGKYLWNMGLFAGSEKVFFEAFEKFAPELKERYQKLLAGINDRDHLEEVYLSLPSEPIDTALAEKVENLEVVAGSFDWADIGSFFDLHKILQDHNNNSLKGDIELIDSEDVMVHGSDKPIVVIGLSGVVVVDSPNGLLVCAKEKSQLVGDAAKRLQKRSNSKLQP